MSRFGAGFRVLLAVRGLLGLSIVLWPAIPLAVLLATGLLSRLPSMGTILAVVFMLAAPATLALELSEHGRT
jgi:hypothetical protein